MPDLSGQGEKQRDRRHTSIHTRTSETEDRNLILCSILNECFSGEERHLSSLLTARIDHKMEDGLQKTLQSESWHVLWGAQQAAFIQLYCIQDTRGYSPGQREVYCLNTGRVLKRRSFTPMPLPDSIITKVNAIGKKENQGRKFQSTDWRNKPFSWTDEVQADDMGFQGLPEQEEAPFPDISAKPPGIELERNQTDDQTNGPTNAVNDDPEPDFEKRVVFDRFGMLILDWVPESRIRRLNILGLRGKYLAIPPARG